MRIVLIRHGEPDLGYWQSVSAQDMAQWIEAYNAAGIKSNSLPTKSVIDMMFGCSYFVCSDLDRSIQSAKILGTSQINHIDPLFREAGLPYARWKGITLSPTLWSVLFRVWWLFGYSENSESYKEAKQRARIAANQLLQLARQHEFIVLVGHGIMNKLIGKELLSHHWKQEAVSGNGYWSFRAFSFNEGD
jgi:broad specificity phosphatase PhoE